MNYLIPSTNPRTALANTLLESLSFWRGVVLVGPRQVGKTTLARQLLPRNSPNYFDLEDPRDAARLADPMLALAQLEGLVVIDEVQHHPKLFESLRVLMDRPEKIQLPGQYLLLGSAAPQLLQQTTESLLGRVKTIEVSGFGIHEVTDADSTWHKLWLRGGFPLAYTAPSESTSVDWRFGSIQSFLQRDLPLLGINASPTAMLRFWRMLCHYHGQIWNAAEPARSMGVNETTVRRYLDHLTDTFMVRQLQPWHQNLAKRQVKSPKIYFRDSGLLHVLLGIESASDLWRHPLSGASWEGFAMEQILRIAQPDEAYFWATHQGAELDLLMLRGSQRIGVEFKRSDAPSVTRSMRTAIDDLKLDALYVVHGGNLRYRMAEGIEAVPLWAVLPFSDS
jgi:predicted AAA+ superfamily ATPase